MDHETEFQQEYKLVILGDVSVGKSSIALRYIHDEFNENTESTIGGQFISKSLVYQNTNIKLNIWDTAGQEKFKALAPIYFRDAQAALIVFDLGSKDTYKQVKYWQKQLDKDAPQNIQIVVVGNKLDLLSESEQQKEIKSTEYECCSAKTGKNIKYLFDKVTQMLLDTRVPIQSSQRTQLKKPPKNKMDACKNQC